MKFQKIYTLVLLLGLALNAFAQNPKAESGLFALTNATIETVTNGTIENGTLIIQDGLIAELGTDISIPEGAKTIDCTGLTLYPGMIDGGTRLGLSEIGSVPETNDYSDVGGINPQLKALTAVNPNSVAIPVTRTNGVTTVLTMPSGGLFPGTSALINLHGYTPKQMYADFEGIKLQFPRAGKRGRRDRRTPEEVEKEYKKSIKELDDFWTKAVDYAKIDSATGKARYIPELIALLPVVRKEAPLMVEVNAAKDIMKAIKWVEDKGINVIFTGVDEGWRVADSLAAAKIPVITGPVLTNPSRSSDRYDRPYANAGLMLKAGVKVAIRTADTENVRNLPFNAGFAAAYGMGKEEALKAVTIVPAEIFGVADKLGSLEKGKVANLFAADGDPFETKTQVKYLFIGGWKIPLVNRHTQLYDEFLERDPGVKK
ncbi:amidohydrolase family protein [Flammeovirgaceae bacterium SG7u.111]|nr:amidohydrolase family protein [Flammeovirgaceae bacterium SG7u.132]WPO35262.1 amidohydrolase family protein [Flammeovirgaceae bacterium SG7u.111]